MSKLFTTILPSLLAGGLLFGSALTGAQPAPPTPPTPPTPATAPQSPKPPKPPKVKGQIHIDLGDLDDMVDEQIQNALEAIGDNDQIPPHVREALKQRLEKVRVKVKKRIAKVGPNDLEGLKVELGQMGEELGQEMEQFGKEMEKWGKDFEKHMEKQVDAQVKQHKKLKWKGPGPGAVIVDLDDEADLPDAVDMNEDDNVDDAVRDMGALGLDPAKKAELKRLREESDRKVEDAKHELDQASDRLRSLIEDNGAKQQDIETAVDRVASLEAKIRKARIVAWVKARSLLDSNQRQKIERTRGRSK